MKSFSQFIESSDEALKRRLASLKDLEQRRDFAKSKVKDNTKSFKDRILKRKKEIEYKETIAKRKIKKASRPKNNSPTTKMPSVTNLAKGVSRGVKHVIKKVKERRSRARSNNNS